MEVRIHWYIPRGKEGIGPGHAFKALPTKARVFKHTIGSKFMWAEKEDRHYLGVTVPTRELAMNITFLVETFLLNNDVTLDRLDVYPDGSREPDRDTLKIIHGAFIREDHFIKAVRLLKQHNFDAAKALLNKYRLSLEKNLDALTKRIPQPA